MQYLITQGELEDLRKGIVTNVQKEKAVRYLNTLMQDVNIALKNIMPLIPHNPVMRESVMETIRQITKASAEFKQNMDSIIETKGEKNG